MWKIILFCPTNQLQYNVLINTPESSQIIVYH